MIHSVDMTRMTGELKIKLSGKDTAVSDVIGVILMVAVTVIMAAIVMSWSSGVSAPEVPKQCGISVTRDNQTSATVTIYSIKPTGTSVTNLSYTSMANTTFTQINTTGVNNATRYIGENGQITLASYNEHVVVKVLFSDGEEIVAYDGKI